MVRSALKIAGTLLIAHGYMKDAMFGEVSGLVMTAASVYWSQRQHADTPAQPEVKRDDV